MTHGFQQQDSSVNFSFHKSAPTPHGQEADRKTAAPAPRSRSLTPHPGR